MQSKKTIIVLALLFIIVGTLITLENFNVINGITKHWAVFLLITGSGFTLLFFQRNKADLVLLWLGTFVFILGIFCYYLNFSSWGRLSVLWPFFLGIVGLSFLSIGLFSKIPLFIYFAMSFLALFAVFSLVFSISYKLWPMSIVVFGISLLLLDHFQKKMKT